MLVHEVFDKVLYLTPSARAQFSSGRIFNLVTTDAETLQMLFQNILGVISSPARIIGSMAMLYVQLGPSSLVALAVLILMMPAQVRSCLSVTALNISAVIGSLAVDSVSELYFGWQDANRHEPHNISMSDCCSVQMQRDRICQRDCFCTK